MMGLTAVHPSDCEMFLLFVHLRHAGCGVGRQLLAAAHDGLEGVGLPRGRPVDARAEPARTRRV
jgi:GNAT superfamily N-acetyltransferase